MLETHKNSSGDIPNEMSMSVELRTFFSILNIRWRLNEQIRFFSIEISV